MQQESSNVDTALNLTTSRESMPIGMVDPVVVLINEKITISNGHNSSTEQQSRSEMRGMNESR